MCLEEVDRTLSVSTDKALSEWPNLIPQWRPRPPFGHLLSPSPSPVPLQRCRNTHARSATAALHSAESVDEGNSTVQNYLLTSISDKGVNLPPIAQLQSVHAATFSCSTVRVKGGWRYWEWSCTPALSCCAGSSEWTTHSIRVTVLFPCWKATCCHKWRK